MAESDIRPDNVLYPGAAPKEESEEVLEEDRTGRMIRQPTDADFEGVLTPEGNSGDIGGSDISDSTVATDASLGGTG